MNKYTKYIKADFNNAEVLIKTALHNGLASLEQNESDTLKIPKYIDMRYIEEIMKNRGWIGTTYNGNSYTFYNNKLVRSDISSK